MWNSLVHCTGRTLLAGGLALGLASVAGAADLPTKASPAPYATPVMTWTGLYIGGYAGGTWGNASFRTTAPPVQVNSDFSGFIGGLYVGYDYQLPNNVVIGARVSVPIVTEVTESVVYSAGGPPITVGAKANWAVLLNATVGYAMGRFMPYVGAGVAFANTTIDASVVGLFGSDSHTHTGLSLLAGAKYMFAEGWSLGVEYNYTTFEKQTYVYPALFGTATGDFGSSTVVATIDYRF